MTRTSLDLSRTACRGRSCREPSPITSTVGKRPEPVVGTAPATEDSSRRIFITDLRTGTRFLIDTGADVSVIPVTTEDCKYESLTTLTAANKSCIKTYGARLITVDIGLRREFTHTFIIADVGCPILGADFLSEFNLLPDLSKRRLVDGVTGLSTAAGSRRDVLDATSRSTKYRARRLAAVDLPDQIKVSTAGVDPRVREMLHKYPDVLRPNFKTKDVKHNVVHHIKTNCPPISTRPRRLAPDKLRPVKADFEQMVAQGICKRANSPWSSAITVVPKKTGEWRSCGDFRPLNAATLPDKYPIPHIQDFNQSIGTAKVFGTIDLIRAYHQIPVAPDDVNKTAVTTPFGNFVFFAMPFGLRNAAQTFERFMDEVVRGLDFVYVYIDDLLIFSDDEESHLRHTGLTRGGVGPLIFSAR